MTEIEKKALALMNEVARERGSTHDSELLDRGFVDGEALCRAIEQHEAFRQEVSDAVELANMRVKELKRNTSYIVNHMQQYIIPKPVDPLVEALSSMGWFDPQSTADDIRTAMQARGYEWRKIGEGA